MGIFSPSDTYDHKDWLKTVSLYCWTHMKTHHQVHGSGYFSSSLFLFVIMLLRILKMLEIFVPKGFFLLVTGGDTFLASLLQAQWLSQVWLFVTPWTATHLPALSRELLRPGYWSGVLSSWPRDGTHISCIDRQILYHWHTQEAHVSRKAIFFFFREKNTLSSVTSSSAQVLSTYYPSSLVFELDHWLHTPTIWLL